MTPGSPPRLRRLILVRHGRTAANAEGRTIAVTDAPLDREGRRQASRVARVLAPERPDRILVSPRRRARQTADAILRRLPQGSGAEVDDRLREIGVGAFEGRTPEEIARAGLDGVFRSWREGAPPRYPPGAETFDTAARRLEALYRELRAGEAASVVLVGHSHALRTLLAACVLGAPADAHRGLVLDHGGVAVVEWEGTLARVRSLNAR